MSTYAWYKLALAREMKDDSKMYTGEDKKFSEKINEQYVERRKGKKRMYYVPYSVLSTSLYRMPFQSL